jgi:hypothetical protein
MYLTMQNYQGNDLLRVTSPLKSTYQIPSATGKDANGLKNRTTFTQITNRAYKLQHLLRLTYDSGSKNLAYRQDGRPMMTICLPCQQGEMKINGA